MIIIVKSKISNFCHHNKYDNNEKFENCKHSQNVIQTHGEQMLMANGARKMVTQSRVTTDPQLVKKKNTVTVRHNKMRSACIFLKEMKSLSQEKILTTLHVHCSLGAIIKTWNQLVSSMDCG